MPRSAYNVWHLLPCRSVTTAVRETDCRFKQKGDGGDGTLEELVRLAVKPIAFLGSAVCFLGLVYLGIELRGGSRGGGGELGKAVALIAAGGAVVGFAVIYGFSGF